MNKITLMLLCTLLFASNQVSADLVGIDGCGTECEKSLSDIGSYLETKVSSEEVVVSIWSTNNKPVKNCLKENIVNPGSWSEYGEDWVAFRKLVESLVHELCVKPIFGHTNLTIIETFLEKEIFLDPKDNRTYGLAPKLVPKGSFLDQVWVRIRVEKPNKLRQSDAR